MNRNLLRTALVVLIIVAMFAALAWAISGPPREWPDPEWIDSVQDSGP